MREIFDVHLEEFFDLVESSASTDKRMNEQAKNEKRTEKNSNLISFSINQRSCVSNTFSFIYEISKLIFDLASTSQLLNSWLFENLLIQEVNSFVRNFSSSFVILIFFYFRR